MKKLLIIFGCFVALPAVCQTKRLVEISREYYTKDVPLNDGMVYKYSLPTDTARYFNPGADQYEVTVTFKKKGGTPIPVIETVDANTFIGAWKKDASGVFSFSNVTGQTLTHSFLGSVIKLVGYKNSSYGIVAIQVDSSPPVMVDLYEAGLSKAFVMYETTLPMGSHKVTLTVTGQKNTASSNTYCVLDFALITK